MKYFFHFRDASGSVLDEEGGEFSSFDLAGDEAKLSARDMAMEAVKCGDDLANAGCIEMTAGEGVLLTVPLFPPLHFV